MSFFCLSAASCGSYLLAFGGEICGWLGAAEEAFLVPRPFAKRTHSHHIIEFRSNA